ncbi:MAG TPA: trimethylamine methyltransferase family protein [Dehalococcoidia bacterium]|nr:trimethylamine methyltransferase family protein [Dehalococcoidia bacterium]
MHVTQENNALRPRINLLSKELIERIIEEAKDVLEKVGVWVESEEALELLGNGGARIDKGKKRAFIPRNLVEESLKSVPSSVKFYDRNGNFAMDLSGDNFYFNSCTTNYIWDSALNKIREIESGDLIDIIRLIDALENLDGQYPGEATDFPRQVWDLTKLFFSLKYSIKPIMSSLYSKENFQQYKEMLVAVRGSEQALREKPLSNLPICPSPPLRWSDLVCSCTMRGAESGIPVLLMAMPMTGATAPITMAGTIVQHVAENLSGVVIAQLANKGAPIIWSGCPAAFDMRFGTTPYGSIESKMIFVGYSEVGKYLGIPTNGVIAESDAKRHDSQMGLECTMGTTLAALSGINLISGVGTLNFTTGQSLESLVIGNEICGYVRRLIKGITPRGERLAEDLFTEGLENGKHFLLSPNTLKWFKEEYYYPGPVIDRQFEEVWVENGSTTAEQRAKEEAQRILATHQPEPLDKDIDRELVRIMTKEAEKYGMSKLPLP